MAGNVNSGNKAASKAEEDFRQLQEEKKVQDLYIEKLQIQMEEMEQRDREFTEQVFIKETTLERADLARVILVWKRFALFCSKS